MASKKFGLKMIIAGKEIKTASDAEKFLFDRVIDKDALKQSSIEKIVVKMKGHLEKVFDFWKQDMQARWWQYQRDENGKRSAGPLGSIGNSPESEDGSTSHLRLYNLLAELGFDVWADTKSGIKLNISLNTRSMAMLNRQRAQDLGHNPYAYWSVQEYGLKKAPASAKNFILSKTGKLNENIRREFAKVTTKFRKLITDSIIKKKK